MSTGNNEDIYSILSKIMNDESPAEAKPVEPEQPAAPPPLSVLHVPPPVSVPYEPSLEDIEANLASLGFDDIPVPVLAAEVPEEPAQPTEQIIFKDDAPKPEQVIPMPVFTSDEIAEQLDIRNFATLVTLNTARWHGKVKDKKAAEHIASATGADMTAFDAQKRLLAGADAKLKAVHKTIDDARTVHYQMTLPWSTFGRDSLGKRMGGRLLPHTSFQEYIKAMSKAQQSMLTALDAFEADYSDAVTKARQSLGTRFDPTEYPNPASIRNHFGLSFDFHPVPIGDDFKGLADQQIAKLAHTLQKKNRTMLENAMQETWARTFELVKHASDKFNEPDAMFHASLIDKLRDAANSLKNLNVTQDPMIEKVRQAIAKHLTTYDGKSIREDEELRKRLGKIAKACVAEMYTHAANTRQ